MPELAEVAWYSTRWRSGLGDRVADILCRERSRVYRKTDPQEIQRGLKGRKLTRIEAKGKQMLFVFENVSLGLHLGMTGELLVEGRRYEPGKHDHLVIRQGKRSLVLRDPRMFGAVKFSPMAEPQWWKNLPPDILSGGFRKDAVARYAGRRAALPLKAFLLQQEMFPGVGNWMADEILWRCGFHPGRRTGKMKMNEVIMIWRETRKVSRAAMRIIGESWGDVPKSWLFHYRWRDGGKCPRDGAVLRRKEIGGRTTAWCPKCQGK